MSLSRISTLSSETGVTRSVSDDSFVIDFYNVARIQRPITL